MPMPSLQSLKALDSMGKHHAEQRWGQEATLLDSVGHWRGFGGLTVVQDAGHNAIMELVDNYDEPDWAAEFFHDFPESIPTDCIKGLGQIN